jgi:hypothetical protein
MLSGLIACLHELRHLLREKLNLRVALLQLLLQLGVFFGCPWLIPRRSLSTEIFALLALRPSCCDSSSPSLCASRPAPR